MTERLEPAKPDEFSPETAEQPEMVWSPAEQAMVPKGEVLPPMTDEEMMARIRALGGGGVMPAGVRRAPVDPARSYEALGEIPTTQPGIREAELREFMAGESSEEEQ